MKREEIDNLMIDLMTEEVNHKRLDGVASTLLDRYDITNATILSIALYSNMIAFGFQEGKEAGELAEALIENYSSYELKEKAISMFGEDLISFYEKSVHLDYSLTSGPLSGLLDTLGAQLEETMEEFIESNEKLEGLLPKEVK